MATALRKFNEGELLKKILNCPLKEYTRHRANYFIDKLEEELLGKMQQQMITIPDKKRTN